MSRYASLLEPSTIPPKPHTGGTTKHAPKAPVVTAESPSVTQAGITSAPTSPVSNSALRQATARIEHKIKPAFGAGDPVNAAVVGEDDESTIIRARERNFQRSMERNTKRMVKRRNVETNERTKIRHTFDILDDQLLTLREISIERQKMFGRRVLLGELVQEALDLFISKERNNV